MSLDLSLKNNKRIAHLVHQKALSPITLRRQSCESSMIMSIVNLKSNHETQYRTGLRRSASETCIRKRDDGLVLSMPGCWSMLKVRKLFI